MLKMEYFNLRLLLGVLRSKQVSSRWKHHSVYSVNVRGSFKLSTLGASTPGGRHAPCCPSCQTSIAITGRPEV